MFRLFECCALSFFERFVLSFSLKIERFVSDSAEIWICGLYITGTTSFTPAIIHSHDMNRFTPMNQVVGNIKIPIGKYSTYIILTIIFHHTGIRYSGKHRILYVLRE